MQWEKDHQQDLMNRVWQFNKVATSLFSEHGWNVFTPDPIALPVFEDWAAYSTESTKKLWEDIESTFVIKMPIVQ